MSNRAIDSINLGGIVSVRDGLIAQQEEGKKVFRLESGDPSFPTPPHIVEAINKALVDGKTHYTAGAGIWPLREAAAEKIKNENYINTSPSSVFITNGAMHALYIAFRAICDKWSEIIIPNPTWTETADNVTLAGGIPVRVDLDSEFKYTANAIEKKITNNTVAIVINSPHNPTGTVLDIEEMTRILALASKYNLWVISDEAYEHILYGCEHHSPGRFYDKVISIYSFSKSYAMSGLRLGYMCVENNEIKSRVAKLLRCTINGVNSATQYGGIAALTGPQDFISEMVKEYTIMRSAIWSALAASKMFMPVEPRGAFYCWCKINQDEWDGTDWKLTNHLINKHGIGSAPGSVFGPNNDCLRFAFSCSTPQVLEASKILEKM